MNFEYYTLPSGIRCILKRVKSPVAHCAITIGAGTRDEDINQHGIAHLIEHMLFKGTNKRRAYHINSLLDNVGGEINAYTTKEETVIHTTCLKQDIRKACDLLTDVVYSSTFVQKEIDKEIGVIMDEIDSYKDSPAELIYDDFEDMLFKGSTLGRNILGTKKSLKKLKTDDLYRFVEEKYNTDRTVFSVIGDITYGRFKELCDKYFGAIESSTTDFVRISAPEYVPQELTINKRTHQAHCIIGSRAYPYVSDKRVATVLALNILGGISSNSRLNMVLREKYGITYNIEANYTSYFDTGVAAIYFGTDTEKLDRALELVYKELNIMRETTLSSLQLSRAKKQLIAQLAISSESSEGYMLNCAKSYLLFGEVDSPERINSAISEVSPNDIMEVMNELFAENRLSKLVYL